MRESLVAWLRCPSCRGALALKPEEWSLDHVMTGCLGCDRCGASYPIVRGIPRFVPTDFYTGNFSFQWNRFARTQVDEGGRDSSAVTFVEKTGLRPESLKGRLVLDVGVGSGRYADVVERAGATMIGIDLSFAVDAAFTNFGGRERMHLVQADVFSLPFDNETFDAIYSIGVLHHTRDCRQAFLALPPLLKTDGRIGIWVYAAARSQVEDRANRAWRRLAARLPQRALFGLCVAASVLAYAKKVPLVKPVMKYLLPRIVYDSLPLVDDHPRFQERVLKTFDWYSPAFQSRHTYPEVFAWFEEAGLSAIRILPTPIAMQGARGAG